MYLSWNWYIHYVQIRPFFKILLIGHFWWHVGKPQQEAPWRWFYFYLMLRCIDQHFESKIFSFFVSKIFVVQGRQPGRQSAPWKRLAANSEKQLTTTLSHSLTSPGDALTSGVTRLFDTKTNPERKTPETPSKIVSIFLLSQTVGERRRCDLATLWALSLFNCKINPTWEKVALSRHFSCATFCEEFKLQITQVRNN